MKVIRFVGLIWIQILSFLVICAGNDKKVYADYHGVRYTRMRDGKLGRWGYYSKTEKSTTGTRMICYNADLIDSLGRHEIAAVHYPMVGMQSNLDDDYIEYQILTAKAAGIDGFFIEWGFKPHENDFLLKAMQRIARKYDFEIGVNWCDGWLYYDWITKIYPQIADRAAKTRYMIHCYQYLVDSVLYAPTAPIVNGRPVFYHFGGGATPDEFMQVLNAVRIGKDREAPAILRRWAEWGQLVNGVYQPVTTSREIERWKSLGETPTAWIPARVRKGTGVYPEFDYWASSDDVLHFMQPFRDSVWLARSSLPQVKSGFAMPGMDNRGCAGWGHSVFYLIDRGDGSLYDRMWQFCLQNKDSLDMMFVASWNDYTEGHEIEPTVECGYRELETTLKNVAAFKGVKSDDAGLKLPLRLFTQRKELEFLYHLGMDVQFIALGLDQAAQLLSHGMYDEAGQLLDQFGQSIAERKASVRSKTVSLTAVDLTIKGHSEAEVWYTTDGITVTQGLHINLDLNALYNRGIMEFDYWDAPDAMLFVRSSTRKMPKREFDTVGKIVTTGSGTWKQARIMLYGETIDYPYNKPAFYIKGNTKIKNISIQYNLYSI